MTDQEFQKRSETTLDALKRSLYDAEGEADFEVEEASGALQINFDDPPERFIARRTVPSGKSGSLPPLHQLQTRLVRCCARLRAGEIRRGIEGPYFAAHQRTIGWGRRRVALTETMFTDIVHCPKTGGGKTGIQYAIRILIGSVVAWLVLHSGGIATHCGR